MDAKNSLIIVIYIILITINSYCLGFINGNGNKKNPWFNYIVTALLFVGIIVRLFVRLFVR